MPSRPCPPPSPPTRGCPAPPWLWRCVPWRHPSGSDHLPNRLCLNDRGSSRAVAERSQGTVKAGGGWEGGRLLAVGNSVGAARVFQVNVSDPPFNVPPPKFNVPPWGLVNVENPMAPRGTLTGGGGLLPLTFYCILNVHPEGYWCALQEKDWLGHPQRRGVLPPPRPRGRQSLMRTLQADHIEPPPPPPPPATHRRTSRLPAGHCPSCARDARRETDAHGTALHSFAGKRPPPPLPQGDQPAPCRRQRAIRP